MSAYLMDEVVYDLDLATRNPRLIKAAIATGSKSKNLLSLLCDDEFIGTVGIPLGNPNIDKKDIHGFIKYS